ncbi:hypothetical protein CLI84_05825 [Porphyromonas gingivalis]|nr:hypothetical protein CLI84_05825 [Porphyromonas gingivalis]
MVDEINILFLGLMIVVSTSRFPICTEFEYKYTLKGYKRTITHFKKQKIRQPSESNGLMINVIRFIQWGRVAYWTSHREP